MTSLIDAISDSSLHIERRSLESTKSLGSLGVLPRLWPTWHLLWLTIAANFLTAFPTSLQFVGLNFPQKEIETFMNESFQRQHNQTLKHHELSLLYGGMVSTPFLVGLFGSLVIKHFLEKYGRCIVLFLGCGLFTSLSSVLYVIAVRYDSYQVLFLARFLYGIAWSCQMNGMPLYLTECCPPEVRGLVPTLLTCMVNVGFVFIYILALPQLLGNAKTWPYLFLLTLGPGLLSIIAGLTFPESPKYTYLHQGGKDPVKLRKVIQWFYGKKVNVEKIIESFAQEAHQAQLRLSLLDILRTFHLRKALVIAVALALMRVTCGAMLITVFSTAILDKELSVNPLTSKYAMIGVVCSYTMFSAMGAWLSERTGRRKILIGCTLVMILAEVLFVLTSLIHEKLDVKTPWLDYLGLIAILSVSATFQMGPATITLFYVTEISPHAARASITTFSLVAGILGRLIYFLLFPVLQDKLGVYSIIIMFLVPTCALMTFLYFEMPETRQKHVHEIVDIWIAQHNAKMDNKRKEIATDTSDKGTMVTLLEKNTDNKPHV